eukprot:CAMPEP_0172611338 /NCGR_PEP_ID=MMETSP1068-20121228/31043_1 /TAXON_ID=35684 /ORGANISM="Pseudopedinella elastica, Strain CCMP716" /LENGTH=329 /DNA_ID=CAMNT_0013415285 /DNA_START=219 /DNA_END=1204 /DNA_ORIENTATION=-
MSKTSPSAGRLYTPQRAWENNNSRGERLYAAAAAAAAAGGASPSGGSLPGEESELTAAASNIEVLRSDVEALRRVATAQQQAVESLREHHALAAQDATRNEATLLDLAAARPGQDAWAAETHASLASAHQQLSALYGRMERCATDLHERPSRPEVGACVKAACEPLRLQVESAQESARHLEGQLRRLGDDLGAQRHEADALRAEVRELREERRKGEMGGKGGSTWPRGGLKLESLDSVPGLAGLVQAAVDAALREHRTLATSQSNPTATASSLAAPFTPKRFFPATAQCGGGPSPWEAAPGESSEQPGANSAASAAVKAERAAEAAEAA